MASAIVSILKQQEDGIPAKEICRQWQINLFSGSGRLPGKPMQSVYIKRFNRLYREAVLDVYLFLTFDSSCHGCGQATDKRMDHEYNHRRLHEDRKTY